MANDRIYMECKGCGSQHLLFKYYPSDGYIWTAGTREWMKEHITCNELGNGDLGGNPCFDLVTESDPKFKGEKIDAAGLDQQGIKK